MAYLYCYDPSDYQPTDAERQEAAEAVATIILDGDPLARAAALWGTAFFVAQLEFAEQLEAPAGER